MDWKELKIYTSHENMENLSAALISAGVSGLVINDPEDVKEFAAEKTSAWDYIDDELLKEAASGEPYVIAYISGDEDGALLAEAVGEALERLRGMGIGIRTESGSIREEDWANEWKKYFKPQPIGEKLIIKPTWETLKPTERKIIELDPESSFGTGRHYTTQICLELLEKNISGGEKIIDLGCGSGIIFISAMALGASKAVGVDISEDAVKISHKNALQNGIPENDFAVFQGDITTDGKLFEKVAAEYDIVAANIVADVLLGMKDIFPKLVKRDGVIILSGIIDGRLEEILEAMKERGFEPTEILHRDIWNGGIFKAAK